MGMTPQDHRFMQRALQLARQAFEAGEVPVGAVVTVGDAIIGEGRNATIKACDPTAHAEVTALRAAAADQKNYRLPAATLYTTLEPCPMCAGAIVLARIARVVFATHDPRAGSGGSVFNLLQAGELNHRCEVETGLCAEQSANLLREFFRARR